MSRLALSGAEAVADHFGAQSTAAEVLTGIDLSGVRVLVTGVSGGLGAETARAVAAAGAKVIGTARDIDKAARALSAHTTLGIDVVECDLASLANVRACVDALLTRGETFDVIIANAGVMNCPLTRTVDGFETQFATNHLGHFVLVNRLVPLISKAGRIVVVSSRAHQASDVDLDDPGFQHTAYDPFLAYGRSKTANILFAMELDRRFSASGIRATALQPGGIRTELLRHTSPEMLQRMAAASARSAFADRATPPIVKTIEQGAATSVWSAFVATAEHVGGHYCEDCHVAEARVAGSEGVRPYAIDAERAKKLWALSEQMVAEQFT